MDIGVDEVLGSAVRRSSIVTLGTFGSGVKLDVMEGNPILYGRRSWKWLGVASIDM